MLIWSIFNRVLSQTYGVLCKTAIQIPQAYSQMIYARQRMSLPEQRHLSPAPPMTKVLSAAEGLLVEVTLQKFLQVKGLSPRVVLILKEGYNLLFKIKPLTREPLIRQRICKSPQEDLPEGDIAFPPQKASSGKSQNPVISGFQQPSFPCSKAQPKLYLGTQYLQIKTFKEETPESVKQSLQKRESLCWT